MTASGKSFKIYTTIVEFVTDMKGFNTNWCNTG